MKMLYTRIKYWVLVKIGKLRCSGYMVYPNGIKCTGCSDCRKERRGRAKHTKEQLYNTIEFLWDIIDDIDTASDIAKGDTKSYENLVHRFQRRRWKSGIKTEGYELQFEGLKDLERVGDRKILRPKED